jgi:hypothetical protein
MIRLLLAAAMIAFSITLILAGLMEHRLAQVGYGFVVLKLYLAHAIRPKPPP